jgi:ubiquinone/menaquinone biosynthesis C-methylase UbiE
LRVLVIGTGNSDLKQEIVAAGVEGVIVIDFARPAIVKSRRRSRETENITWKVLDVRTMSFADGDFDLVVDQATVDCIFFAGEGEVFTTLSAISHVLKSRGVSVCMSSVPLESRRPFLDRPMELRMRQEEIIQLDKLVPSAEKQYVFVLRKIGKIVSETAAMFIHEIRSPRSQFYGKCHLFLPRTPGEPDRAGEIEQQTRRNETECVASEGEMCKRRPLTAADPFLSLRIIQNVHRTTVGTMEGHPSYDHEASIVRLFIRP